MTRALGVRVQAARAGLVGVGVLLASVAVAAAAAIGLVHIPVYIPRPCQRWCASIGETLISPGCTQGRW